MNTSHHLASMAERRDQFDRMAGLLVAFLCCIGTFSAGLLTWAVLC